MKNNNFNLQAKIKKNIVRMIDSGKSNEASKLLEEYYNIVGSSDLDYHKIKSMLNAAAKHETKSTVSNKDFVPATLFHNEKGVRERYKRILYLGWLGQGNVGDDVLFHIFKTLLFSACGKLSANIIIDSAFIGPYQIDLSQYDLVVLGGGSLFSLDYWEDLCLSAKRLNIPVVTWGTGVDIRDTKTIEMITGAFKNGMQIKSGREKSHEVLEYACLASTRGNMTKFVMASDKLEVIGDPCLIMAALYNNYPEVEELHEFLLDERPLVMVNWGTSMNCISGGSEEEVSSVLKEAIEYLIFRGYKIIIYPLWTSDIESCKNLTQGFDVRNVYCLGKVYEAGYLAGLAKKSVFSINFKLHANILSASQVKPFLSLAYGLKCYDFAESVNCEELLLDTSCLKLDNLINRIDYLEQHLNNISLKLNEYLNIYYIKQYDYMLKIIRLLDNN